jgi:hypothetical protein
MIYYFVSSESDDQLTKDVWELFNWFIPLNLKEKPVEGTEGLIISPERSIYEVEKISWGDNLEPAPFMMKDMRHQFIDGIFKALK